MAAEAPLRRLSRDLLVEVLSRIGDGPTLAFAACACLGLRRAATEEALWEELCHGAWPSTKGAKAKELVSSMPGGFAKLYADSFPLLLYSKRRPTREAGGASASGEDTTRRIAASEDLALVSFVDVYYKGKCVLSRVVHGVPACEPPSGSLGCHFKISIPNVGAHAGCPETGTPPPPSILLEPKAEGGVGVLNWMLEEDLALSWVLVDVKGGRAVNLSGGKPVSVQRNASSAEDLVVRFGCPVPVEKRLVACGVAECNISMSCQYSELGESLSCTEIELQVDDGEGTHLDGHRSLEVLRWALCRQLARSRNRRAVEEGYRAYLKDRKEMQWRKIEGKAVPQMSALIRLAVLFLLALCTLTYHFNVHIFIY